ncbi:MAG: hydantoinase/oxoprolinase family protein [Acidimicrobiia bacterium]|nr:hydantoinase/oxoprolinase family protein [Acidimicrobiia bacterium]
MGSSINIDTGGTFTDGYFTRGEQSLSVKVDTTPHDLTECLARCIAEGATGLGYPNVQALLLDTDAVRFSSTIGTNSIIQRTGPRIGLLVSAGAADSLYGDGESSLYEFFLRKDLVAEVADPTDEEEVRGHIRRLLVGGARILVASLRGSEDDPGGEEAVKKVVQRDYPRHYLGAVPCLVASEVTPRPGAELRTSTAVINAYLHFDMVKSLYKADEDLRTGGYPHPLLIVHASGGVARVAKTKAIETYNSGPVGGVYGAARLAELYGLHHLVTMDVGGTSTDVAAITSGVVPFDRRPTVAGIPVHTPMVEVHAIGGGGGSVARRTGAGYTVGPDSMGATPGPACYGLGGSQPTACDAEVVLGHIDPDWFLGGRRRLDAARARKALESIAGDDGVETAALGVHRALVKVAGDEVARVIEASGVPATQYVLLAFGGGGGLYGAEVAKACGIPTVMSSLRSSVFSAFGISGMDLSHVYELPPDRELASRLAVLRDRAALDAAGEGFDPAALRFQVEVESDAGLEIFPIDPSADWDALRIQVPSGARAARLRATVPIPHAPIVGGTRGEPDPSAAKKGEREVVSPDGVVEATVYDRALLRPGHVVHGPALVEAVDTTIVVPAGSTFSVDDYGTGIIEGAA